MKAFFQKGLYPTERQFADLIDSFRHKGDKVPLTEVSNLPETLNTKYDKTEATQLESRVENNEETIDLIVAECMHLEEEINGIHLSARNLLRAGGELGSGGLQYADPEETKISKGALAYLVVPASEVDADTLPVGTKLTLRVGIVTPDIPKTFSLYCKGVQLAHFEDPGLVEEITAEVTAAIPESSYGVDDVFLLSKVAFPALGTEEEVEFTIREVMLCKGDRLIGDWLPAPESMGGGGETADWNAADGEPGYIKNKPFYDYTEDYLHFQPECVNEGSLYQASAAAEGDDMIVPGQTYVVSFGQEVKEVRCVAMKGDSEDAIACLTDSKSFDLDQPLNGGGHWAIQLRRVDVTGLGGPKIPTLAFYADFDFSDVAVTVKKVSNTKLDPKYLPMEDILEKVGAGGGSRCKHWVIEVNDSTDAITSPQEHIDAAIKAIVEDPDNNILIFKTPEPRLYFANILTIEGNNSVQGVFEFNDTTFVFTLSTTPGGSEIQLNTPAKDYSVDLDIDSSQQADGNVMVFKARQSKEELKAIYNAINNDLSGCRLRVKANLDSDNYWMFTFPTAVRSVSGDSIYLTLDYFVSESNISAHCALMPDGSAVFTMESDAFMRREDYEREAAKRAFIPIWNDACITRYQGYTITYGRYNEATGYFELNGIKDLTFEQALRIYNAGRIHGSKDSSINAESFYVGCDIRTNLPPVPFSGTGTSQVTLNNTFRASLVEVATCINATIGTFAFTFCYNLRQIGTKEAPMGDINTCGKLDNAKLEIVYGKLSANHDLDVSACPLLTLENFQYWVLNASNTAVITIKVHSDIYSKLTGEDPEWQQVLQTASQKNISFAA